MFFSAVIVCLPLLIIIGCSSAKDDPVAVAKLVLPGGGDITGISFRNANHGIAVTASGEAFVTQDGGLSFQKSEFSSSSPLADACYLDDGIVFIFGRSGLLAHATDGGKNFSKIALDTTYDLRAMKFLDEDHGFLVGVINVSPLTGTGVIGRSSDKGMTWQFDTTEYHGFSVVTTAGNTHVWILGTDAVLYSVDQGATWEHNAQSGKDAVHDLSFSDLEHGWSVGDHGLLRQSTDGGWSWQTKKKLTDRRLSCVVTTSEEIIYLAGDRFFAFTTNYGRLWIVDSLSPTVIFTDIEAADKNVYIAGASGTILKLGR